MLQDGATASCFNKALGNVASGGLILGRALQRFGNRRLDSVLFVLCGLVQKSLAFSFLRMDKFAVDGDFEVARNAWILLLNDMNTVRKPLQQHFLSFLGVLS